MGPIVYFLGCTIKRLIYNMNLKIYQSLIIETFFKDLRMTWNHLLTSVILLYHTLGVYLNKKQFLKNQNIYRIDTVVV